MGGPIHRTRFRPKKAGFPNEPNPTIGQLPAIPQLPKNRVQTELSGRGLDHNCDRQKGLSAESQLPQVSEDSAPPANRETKKAACKPGLAARKTYTRTVNVA